jgi:hypothetical protein
MHTHTHTHTQINVQAGLFQWRLCTIYYIMCIYTCRGGRHSDSRAAHEFGPSLHRVSDGRGTRRINILSYYTSQSDPDSVRTRGNRRRKPRVGHETHNIIIM